MYPFIHIGPLTLGTYGLMVAIGLICAFFVLRADFARRRISADAEAIIGITGLSGLAGSRLYHLLETPADFFADPWPQLFSTMGFAFFGAVIGGFLALLYLARRFKMPSLLMLDAASPGSGQVFDWRLAQNVPDGTRLLLAGGLTPENVADAIAQVKPWGVDAATGVESEPGRKDPRRLRAFVAAARAADPPAYEGEGEGPYDWQEEA